MTIQPSSPDCYEVHVAASPASLATFTGLSSSFSAFLLISVKQVAQLSQRDRTAGGLVMAKSGRLELGDNIYRYYKSIFNQCDVFGQQSNQIQ